MKLELTQKGEAYLSKLRRRSEESLEEFKTASDRGSSFPKYDYVQGRRLYILEKIHAGQNLIASLVWSENRHKQYVRPQRAYTFKDVAMRELNELVRLGYVEEV